MKYSFDMGIWNSIFAVPAEIVDKHLKLAGKEQLKVILWILRHSGESFDTQQIAKAVGIRDENAEESIEYWIECGILKQNENTLEPTVSEVKSAKTAEPVTPAQTEKAEMTEQPAKKRMIKPDGLYVATRVNESQELRFLMEETENTLGKTLSPALTSALVSIHEDLGLPVEVMVMMIGYVKSVGKTGTSYIESVARDWSQSEIFSIDAAEKKLQELDNKSRAWRKLEGIFGTYHRAATKKEEAFAYTWVFEWKMSDELLSEAYERCISNTGKLSLAYMNRILERWHNSGYNTLEDINTAETQEKQGKQSYNIEELEDLSFFSPLEE